jgi:hypothetical protein
MRLLHQVVYIPVGPVFHIQAKCFLDGFGVAVMPARRDLFRLVAGSDRFSGLFEEEFSRFQVSRF